MHTEQTEKEKHLFAGSDFWGLQSGGLQISALYDVCVCSSYVLGYTPGSSDVAVKAEHG